MRSHFRCSSHRIRLCPLVTLLLQAGGYRRAGCCHPPHRVPSSLGNGDSAESRRLAAGCCPIPLSTLLRFSSSLFAADLARQDASGRQACSGSLRSVQKSLFDSMAELSRMSDSNTHTLRYLVRSAATSSALAAARSPCSFICRSRAAESIAAAAILLPLQPIRLISRASLLSTLRLPSACERPSKS